MFDAYQILLLVILVTWPLVIAGLLFTMSKIETWIGRTDATISKEAGLEPVAGRSQEREVKIVFGDKVVGSPD